MQSVKSVGGKKGFIYNSTFPARAEHFIQAGTFSSVRTIPMNSLDVAVCGPVACKTLKDSLWIFEKRDGSASGTLGQIPAQ